MLWGDKAPEPRLLSKAMERKRKDLLQNSPVKKTD